MEVAGARAGPVHGGLHGQSPPARQAGTEEAPLITRLLDTDTCVELIRNKSQVVRTRFKLQPSGTSAISSITLAELEFGVAHSSDPDRNRLALIAVRPAFEVLPFDGRAAAAYGRVRSALERAGTPVGALDTLIAAHALSLGVVLVTNNIHEFRRIPGLSVESWLK